MLKRKVVFAKLHQVTYAPEVGELKATFPSPDKTLDNLSMELDEHGNLYVSFKYKGKSKELFFHGAQLQVVELAALPAAVVKPKVV